MNRPETLDEAVRLQIEKLRLDPARPLIVSDADEVLLQFVVGLERYLDRKGLWLDLQSFALTGNIKRKDTGAALAAEEMPALLADFFSSEAHALEAVPDAAVSLAHLSRKAQIVVLSNVPPAQRQIRADCLAAQGMAYPVIANSGLKGEAVKCLAQQIDAPIFFLDDIPHNIASVARAHAASHRIHFIADERLARLLGPAEHSHYHTTKWPEARQFIEMRLGELDF